MEIKQITDKFSAIIKKHRYVLIILAVGIFLMALPVTGKNVTTSKSNDSVQTQSADTINQDLTGVLQQIKGVGEVRLLLTTEANGETVYQSDRDTSSNENGQNARSETVIITDTNRNQSGLVQKQTAPIYRGAVVVCGGGDNPSVRLAVTQAVMTSTGLSADQICVLKMK